MKPQAHRKFTKRYISVLPFMRRLEGIMMRTGLALVGVAIIALLAGVVVGSYLLPTSPPTPAMALSATSVAKGALYNVTLSGFPASTSIYGWTVNENPPRHWLVGMTDSSGNLQVSGNAPNATGLWPLVACDETYQYWANAMLNVTQ